MDYEARARELVLHAQENLESLWDQADGDTAGDFLDSFTTNPTELNQLRHAYVHAAGYWLGEALSVLNNAPSGPYVDHLGAWFNTIQRRRDRLLKGGWGMGSPTAAFVNSLMDDVTNPKPVKLPWWVWVGGGLLVLWILRPYVPRG